MNSHLTRLTLAVASFALFFGVSINTLAAEHPDTTGWKDLIAPDFSNVVDKHGWKIEDGVLVATDHDTLWTKESYGDFVLDLEFKVAK